MTNKTQETTSLVKMATDLTLFVIIVIVTFVTTFMTATVLCSML